MSLYLTRIFDIITYSLILFTAPDDYVSTSSDLTFSQSSSRECVNVSIVNDDELENEEEFRLTLTTGEDKVNLIPDSTTVRITDDDGEATNQFVRCLHIQKFTFFLHIFDQL